MPLYLAFYFLLGHRKPDFVSEKQIATHDKNYDKCDVAFLDLVLLNCIFSKRNWYSVVGRPFLKADNVLHFCSSGGKHLACFTRNNFLTQFKMVEFYTVLKVQVNCQYHDTCDTEWAAYIFACSGIFIVFVESPIGLGLIQNATKCSFCYLF